MYHLRRHRAFYYVFFGDKEVSEAMFKVQADKEVARLVNLGYATI